MSITRECELLERAIEYIEARITTIDDRLKILQNTEMKQNRVALRFGLSILEEALNKEKKAR